MSSLSTQILQPVKTIAQSWSLANEQAMAKILYLQVVKGQKLQMMNTFHEWGNIDMLRRRMHCQQPSAWYDEG